MAIDEDKNNGSRAGDEVLPLVGVQDAGSLDRPKSLIRQPPEDVALDAAALRELGLEHIQRLAGKIWTDHNIHDPGVTILEVLSYALTDLAYRTTHSVEDLLGWPPIALPPSGAEPAAPADHERDSGFFSAREILPCNPVTVKDYRRLAIDCEGVKNAWLMPAEFTSHKVVIGLDSEGKKLRAEPPQIGEEGIEDLVLRGFYVVYLEFEQDAELGDLNDAKISGEIEIFPLDAKDIFPPTVLRVELEFQHWFEGDSVHEVDPADFSPTSVEWRIVDKVEPESIVSLEPVEMEGRELTWAAHFNTDREISSVNFTLAPREAAVDFPLMTEAIEHVLKKDDFQFLKLWVAIYFSKIRRRRDIVRKVLSRLHEHRNLCENFVFIRGLEVEEIAICADIEVKPSANIERILAELIFQVEHFLAPDISFRTLNEMFARGFSADEIFSGPRLDHGFIIDEDLDSPQRTGVVYGSDIINILMDIDGIIAVNEFQMANYLDGIAQPETPRWELKLASAEEDSPRVPRFSRAKSRIRFLVGIIPNPVDETLVQAFLDEFRSKRGRPKLKDKKWDIEIPKGKFRDLSDYTSIENHFPLNYGLGRGELGEGDSPLRRAQANQLKGYLSFYDQLMADFLVRLDQTKEILSVRSHAQQLGANRFSDGTDEFGVLPAQTDLASVTPLRERSREEVSRDNQENAMLDHLLARFGEDFSDYATVLQSVRGRHALRELIEDKAKFLANCPEIFHDRGTGINFYDGDKLREKGNVSGLKKRVRWLVDMAFVKHSSLQVYVSSAGKWRFRVEDFLGSIIIKSVDEFDTDTEAVTAVERLIVLGSSPGNYRTVVEEGNAGTETLQIFDSGISGHPPVAASFQVFDPNSGGRQETQFELVTFFRQYQDNVGSAPIGILLEGDFRFVLRKVSGEKWRYRLLRHNVRRADNHDVALNSAESFTGKEQAERAIDALVERGIDIEAYKPEPGEDTNGPYQRFNIIDSSQAVLAKSWRKFRTLEGSKLRIEELRTYFDRGEFHIIEHTLLRPRDEGTMRLSEDDATRHNPLQVYLDSAGRWRFRVEYDDGDIIAKSAISYDTEDDGVTALKRLLEAGTVQDNYQIESSDRPVPKEYFTVVDLGHPAEPLIAVGTDERAVGSGDVQDIITRFRQFLLQYQADTGNASIAILRDGHFRFHLFQSKSGKWRFRVVRHNVDDPERTDQVLTSPTRGFAAKEEAEDAADKLIENGIHIHNFEISEQARGAAPVFRFSVKEESGRKVATGTDPYPTAQAVKKRTEELRDFFLRLEANKQEIKLVRPRDAEPPMMSVLFDEACSTVSQWDPYSFRISVIFPYWPSRFRHMEFRSFIEKTLHLEAPAHITMKICWINQEQMQELEEAYYAFLGLHAEERPNAQLYNEALARLLRVLEDLKTVYPVATLHDCRQPGGTNPVVLGHTQLGQFSAPERTE